MTEFRAGETYSYNQNTGKFKKERNTKGLTPQQKKIKREQDKKQNDPFKDYHG